jgi:hypothetical protein
MTLIGESFKRNQLTAIWTSRDFRLLIQIQVVLLTILWCTNYGGHHLLLFCEINPGERCDNHKHSGVGGVETGSCKDLEPSVFRFISELFCYYMSLIWKEFPLVPRGVRRTLLPYLLNDAVSSWTM